MIKSKRSQRLKTSTNILKTSTNNNYSPLPTISSSFPSHPYFSKTSISTSIFVKKIKPQESQSTQN